MGRAYGPVLGRRPGATTHRAAVVATRRSAPAQISSPPWQACETSAVSAATRRHSHEVHPRASRASWCGSYPHLRCPRRSNHRRHVHDFPKFACLRRHRREGLLCCAADRCGPCRQQGHARARGCSNSFGWTRSPSNEPRASSWRRSSVPIRTQRLPCSTDRQRRRPLAPDEGSVPPFDLLELRLASIEKRRPPTPDAMMHSGPLRTDFGEISPRAISVSLSSSTSSGPRPDFRRR